MEEKRIISKIINNQKVHYDKLTDIIFIDKLNLSSIDYERTIKGEIFDTCLEITTKCNQSCINCFSNSLPNKIGQELNFDIINDIIAERTQNRIRIGITGGEPFLHSNIEKILDLPSIYPELNFVISTNGLKSNDSILIEKLTTVDWLVTLSIHGLEETHNNYVGINAYKSAVNLLEKLKGNTRVHIYSVLHNSIKNKDIEHLYKLRDQYKVDFLRFILPRPFGRYKKKVDKTKLEFLYKMLDKTSALKTTSSNSEFISVDKTIGLSK